MGRVSTTPCASIESKLDKHVANSWWFWLRSALYARNFQPVFTISNFEQNTFARRVENENLVWHSWPDISHIGNSTYITNKRVAYTIWNNLYCHRDLWSNAFYKHGFDRRNLCQKSKRAFPNIENASMTTERNTYFRFKTYATSLNQGHESVFKVHQCVQSIPGIEKPPIG